MKAKLTDMVRSIMKILIMRKQKSIIGLLLPQNAAPKTSAQQTA